MTNVAHVIFDEDDTGALGLTVTASTHPVTHGLPTNFTWLADPPYADGVNTTNGGFEVIRYTNISWTAVTMFDGTGTSNGSVVYYAFPIYCLNETERDKLVINSVNWILPPNIVINSITPSKTVVGQGRSLSINVTIINQGWSTETFNVTAYADLNVTIIGDEITMGKQNVTLISGNFTTITFIWNTTGVPYGNYTISAYATPVLGETDIDDNTLADGTVFVTFLSDIRGPEEPNHPPDGVVDMWDFGYCGLQYGQFIYD